MSKAGRSSRSSSAVPDLTDHPRSEGIHVFLFFTPNGERFLSHTSGIISAEELCITAAEDAGISPLYHVLFALYDPKSSCWYSPNHVFNPAETGCLVLHYRMRFHFRNWHGIDENEPCVSRYSNKVEHGGMSLFEFSVLEYLFSQAKYEFVNEIVQIEEFQTEDEQNTFQSESLGMAVLHLLHHTMKTDCSLQKVAKKTGFEKCIPKSFAKQISNDNFLTKIRIRRVFTQFVQEFHQTMDTGRFSPEETINKYMYTLERLAPSFGTETFDVSDLKFGQVEDGGGSNITKDEVGGFRATHEIMVSGNKGIHWRPSSGQKRRTNGYVGSFKKRNNDESDVAPPHAWTVFCDFPQLTHAVINEASVLVYTEDNNYMEVQMSSSQEARSFISLLDGYYRLTADAHHYLCHEVAPPRVVLSEANRLHGPIQDTFVLQKMKRSASERGSFLVRWSAHKYRLLLITVLNKNENGSISCHKQFRIHVDGDTFRLESWEGQFSSIKALTDSLSNSVLRSGSESYTVRRCIVPQPRELSNLLVMRNGHDPTAEIHNSAKQVRCQQIKSKDIKQGEHLGRGTRTNIYSGYLHYHGSEGIGGRDEYNNNSADKRKVVLKVLDQGHENIALSFLETATLMNQVSHRHLVLVHGVAVKESEDIMVEEFVEFGPLDVFLRNEKAAVTSRWKLIVAQQLASALNYLESKQVVHGNVCAKNILLARRGLEPGTSPFIKLSDPGIPVNNLTRIERLERIPWIAPECIDSEASISSSADQWSFGVTLLELCNDGNLPMSSCTLLEKERFYQQKGRLTKPLSPELADFISMCLTYEPEERPSFLCLQRKLNEIMKKNPDMTPSEAVPDADPSLFHKRYLKLVKAIGEGHFGKVTLNMYDPANNNKGEMVAVKSLKQENGRICQGWLKEIEILKSLYHCNIVKYKGYCAEMGGQVVQLIMEYLPRGSLQKYLQKEKLSVPQCLLFAQQICEGMNYLHSQRYIHRDLAARNVLVDESENLVKIGDFGLSKYIPEGDDYYRQHGEGDSPVYWYAIECLKYNKFSFPSDIWSFGVTLHEIMNRCDPQQSPPVIFSKMLKAPSGQFNNIVELLESGWRLRCPRDCPHEARIMMEDCWAADPAARPSFLSLKQKLEDIRKTYDWQNNFILNIPPLH
ncbi:non-receptor tyrosine-protein kinase TYK2 isoform X1 [Synchiropus splendidus]|uniref:non-receptor tyrosine-protein kinase TYK2 isoform X1 n=2 Tax=Synchiropus splendidus TaxID=270530 RepID=UPI00237D5D95|nr:non-receptor tyrosine-protein kinase TYK2 isoform X1 [Synchiropus splendidus]XP_053707942.1 non-receptor tyrosine-protein kinase TYK2 isoform X1 [Synchiropus splendidus]